MRRVRKVSRYRRRRPTMPEPGRGEERRRAGRVREGTRIACNHGSVMDLSTGGMRILSKRRLRATVSIDLWDSNRGVRLEARVVWAKHLGFRKWMIGMAFRELDPSTKRDLSMMAADNRIRFDSLVAA